MLHSTRRDFLKLSSASLVALMSGASLLHPFSAMAQRIDASGAPVFGKELVMLCGTDERIPNRADYKPVAGTINGYDVAAKEGFVINVPFYGHIVNQNEAKPEQAVSFQKWGTLGGLLDLKERKLVQPIPASNGSIFFGHAVFCENGTVLGCTEQEALGDNGKLVLRSFPDLKVIGEFPTFGSNPHEVRTVDHGKTLIVANNKGEGNSPMGNVSWVDYKSGKLLNKIEFLKSGLVPSHLDISYDGWTCVTARTQIKHDMSKLITFVSPKGEVFEPKVPDEINRRGVDEALSIAFLGKSGRVAITIPGANLLIVFDYKTQNLVEVFNLTSPKGVLMDLDPAHGQAAIIVSLSNDKKLLSIVHSENNPPIIVPEYKGFGSNGSHMSRLYV